MIKVAIEVQSGTARFGVAVQARSIQRALSLVGGRFPGRSCRVKAIGAGGSFAEDPDALARMVGTERTHREAA